MGGIVRQSITSLSIADDAILDAVCRYGYLTSEQVCRLLFSRGSLTYVRARLKLLADRGYCLRVLLPRPSQHGSAPSVFRLGRKGLSYFESLGRDVPERFRPSEVVAHSYLFLSHTIALNDFLIAVERLGRAFGGVVVSEVRHEQELKRAPVYVTDGEAKIGVIPDAWIDTRFAGAQFCLALEMDRGTEERKQVQRKIRGYLRYIKGPYQEAFETDSLTVVFVTTAGEGRLRNLVKWTEHVLSHDAAEHHVDLFRFASFDPASIEPTKIFQGPLWYRPFKEQPLPLLTLSN
jgi:hypothetical protein